MDGPKILEEEVNYVAGRIENKMAVGSNQIIIEEIKSLEGFRPSK